MYGFVGFAGNFITSLLPIYLRDHRHLDDETTAWLSGMPLAFGIVSCLTGGAVSDWLIRRLGGRKWGRRLVGFTALVLAGLTAYRSSGFTRSGCCAGVQRVVLLQRRHDGAGVGVLCGRRRGATPAPSAAP
jgi:MFS family permease